MNPLRGGDQGVPVLDFTTPRQVGPTATDLSLGLRVRCDRCALVLGGADLRGIVNDYPIVIDVIAGGVAAAAGRQPGDIIRPSTNGTSEAQWAEPSVRVVVALFRGAESNE